ncbi:hypothetical protein ACIQXV_08835 [Neobacillus sp. NPDC097160]|uniref:hypothetical protein n=1 Tax=Neobacillus sp. NPDC097160 TaxID=3364298 RepID=UPI0037F9FEDD
MGLDKFSSALDLLKGFDVNLYVGEDIFKGKLIGVEADHVVLETENKYIFYYNIDKIQAITKNTKLFQPENTTANFQQTQSLTELLQTFQHSWVTILSINKQRFSGVLSEIGTDFATLISGEERILIKLTHVSNILKGFIKEEVKPKAAKEKAQNDKEAKNNKNDEKGEVTATSQTAEIKTETKTMQTSKAVSTTSEKKVKASIRSEKTEMQQEVVLAAEIVEPNNTMVWSHPIKIEEPVTQMEEHHTSTSIKQPVTTETAHKAKNDMKKPNNDMNQKEKKNEEPCMSKAKPIEPVKEIKPVKEAVIKVETKPVPLLTAPKKEVRTAAKSQQTTTASKPVVSHNNSTKSTENTTSEKSVNDTKNVWKQKDQEKKAFRFAGEPVSRDIERSFPFAGWPKKSKRTFRF